MSFRLFLAWVTLISAVSGLINNNWATLERDVTLRYFSYKNFRPSSDQEKIWNEMGENITCTVDYQGKASVVPPSSFDSSKHVKLFMHGFTGNAHTWETTTLLPAWMERYRGSASVILLDWQPLATWDQWVNITDMIYNEAAYNGIDVGEFAGLCLAELCNSHGLRADLLHLVGHSLGGQSVGKMGRSFQSAHLGGEKVRRITGLDPAGPRFETNGYMDALPDLKNNILTPESANFVDVIHSNGGFTPSALHAFAHGEAPRLGYLQQLGHMDFYPDGGSHQSGCPPTAIGLIGGDACSHGRAVIFYFYSIKEKTLFPSKPCKSVKDCNKKTVESDQVLAYMGEDAEQYYQGGRELFYLDVEDCNWTYKVHNNDYCYEGQELTAAERDLIREVWLEQRNEEVGGQLSLSSVPEEWASTSPELQPIMEEFSASVHKAHQTLVKQTLISTKISGECPLMHEALTMVIKARMALDCGSAAPSHLLGDSDHEDILEATRSCIESEEDVHCLLEKLHNLGKAKSLGPGVVCRALREVESGLKTGMGIFCHQLGAAGSSCSWWELAKCSAKVIAAAAGCIASPSKVKCVIAAIGKASSCVPCICKILGTGWCPI